MAQNIGFGYNIQAREPIDSRESFAGRPWLNTRIVAVAGNNATHLAYVGLSAVDTTDGTTWVVTDVSQIANETGWEKVVTIDVLDESPGAGDTHDFPQNTLLYIPSEGEFLLNTAGTTRFIFGNTPVQRFFDRTVHIPPGVDTTVPDWTANAPQGQPVPAGGAVVLRGYQSVPSIPDGLTGRYYRNITNAEITPPADAAEAFWNNTTDWLRLDAHVGAAGDINTALGNNAVQISDPDAHVRINLFENATTNVSQGSVVYFKSSRIYINNTGDERRLEIGGASAAIPADPSATPPVVGVPAAEGTLVTIDGTSVGGFEALTEAAGWFRLSNGTSYTIIEDDPTPMTVTIPGNGIIVLSDGTEYLNITDADIAVVVQNGTATRVGSDTTGTFSTDDWHRFQGGGGSSDIHESDDYVASDQTNGRPLTATTTAGAITFSPQDTHAIPFETGYIKPKGSLYELNDELYFSLSDVAAQVIPGSATTVTIDSTVTSVIKTAHGIDLVLPTNILGGTPFTNIFGDHASIQITFRYDDAPTLDATFRFESFNTTPVDLAGTTRLHIDDEDIVAGEGYALFLASGVTASIVATDGLVVTDRRSDSLFRKVSDSVTADIADFDQAVNQDIVNYNRANEIASLVATRTQTTFTTTTFDTIDASSDSDLGFPLRNTTTGDAINGYVVEFDPSDSTAEFIVEDATYAALRAQYNVGAHTTITIASDINLPASTTGSVGLPVIATTSIIEANSVAVVNGTVLTHIDSNSPVGSTVVTVNYNSPTPIDFVDGDTIDLYFLTGNGHISNRNLHSQLTTPTAGDEAIPNEDFNIHNVLEHLTPRTYTRDTGDARRLSVHRQDEGTNPIIDAPGSIPSNHRIQHIIDPSGPGGGNIDPERYDFNSIELHYINSAGTGTNSAVLWTAGARATNASGNTVGQRNTVRLNRRVTSSERPGHLDYTFSGGATDIASGGQAAVDRFLGEIRDVIANPTSATGVNQAVIDNLVGIDFIFNDNAPQPNNISILVARTLIGYDNFRDAPSSDFRLVMGVSETADAVTSTTPRSWRLQGSLSPQALTHISNLSNRITVNHLDYYNHAGLGAFYNSVIMGANTNTTTISNPDGDSVVFDTSGAANINTVVDGYAGRWSDTIDYQAGTVVFTIESRGGARFDILEWTALRDTSGDYPNEQAFSRDDNVNVPAYEAGITYVPGCSVRHTVSPGTQEIFILGGDDQAVGDEPGTSGSQWRRVATATAGIDANNWRADEVSTTSIAGVNAQAGRASHFLDERGSFSEPPGARVSDADGNRLTLLTGTDPGLFVPGEEPGNFIANVGVDARLNQAGDARTTTTPSPAGTTLTEASWTITANESFNYGPDTDPAALNLGLLDSTAGGGINLAPTSAGSGVAGAPQPADLQGDYTELRDANGQPVRTAIISSTEFAGAAIGSAISHTVSRFDPDYVIGTVAGDGPQASGLANDPIGQSAIYVHQDGSNFFYMIRSYDARGYSAAGTVVAGAGLLQRSTANSGRRILSELPSRLTTDDLANVNGDPIGFGTAVNNFTEWPGTAGSSLFNHCLRASSDQPNTNSRSLYARDCWSLYFKPGFAQLTDAEIEYMTGRTTIPVDAANNHGWRTPFFLTPISNLFFRRTSVGGADRVNGAAYFPGVSSFQNRTSFLTSVATFNQIYVFATSTASVTGLASSTAASPDITPRWDFNFTNGGAGLLDDGRSTSFFPSAQGNPIAPATNVADIRGLLNTAGQDLVRSLNRYTVPTATVQVSGLQEGDEITFTSGTVTSSHVVNGINLARGNTEFKVQLPPTFYTLITTTITAAVTRGGGAITATIAIADEPVLNARGDRENWVFALDSDTSVTRGTLTVNWSLDKYTLATPAFNPSGAGFTNTDLTSAVDDAPVSSTNADVLTVEYRGPDGLNLLSTTEYDIPGGLDISQFITTITGSNNGVLGTNSNFELLTLAGSTDRFQVEARVPGVNSGSTFTFFTSNTGSTPAVEPGLRITDLVVTDFGHTGRSSVEVEAIGTDPVVVNGLDFVGPNISVHADRNVARISSLVYIGTTAQYSDFAGPGNIELREGDLMLLPSTVSIPNGQARVPLTYSGGGDTYNELYPADFFTGTRTSSGSGGTSTAFTVARQPGVTSASTSVVNNARLIIRNSSSSSRLRVGGQELEAGDTVLALDGNDVVFSGTVVNTSENDVVLRFSGRVETPDGNEFAWNGLGAGNPTVSSTTTTGGTGQFGPATASTFTFINTLRLFAIRTSSTAGTGISNGIFRWNGTAWDTILTGS